MRVGEERQNSTYPSRGQASPFGGFNRYIPKLVRTTILLEKELEFKPATSAKKVQCTFSRMEWSKNRLILGLWRKLDKEDLSLARF